MAKLNVRKGDPVIVISGKDKGKTGQIIEVDTDKGRVTVEGVNMVTKHVKPKKAQQKGGRVDQPSSINSSNVMIVCNACSSPSRIGKKIVQEDGKDVKIRVCKKCGASLEVKESKSKSTAKKATKKKAAAKAEPKAETKTETKAKAEKKVTASEE